MSEGRPEGIRRRGALSGAVASLAASLLVPGASAGAKEKPKTAPKKEAIPLPPRHVPESKRSREAWEEKNKRDREVIEYITTIEEYIKTYTRLLGFIDRDLDSNSKVKDELLIRYPKLKEIQARLRQSLERADGLYLKAQEYIKHRNGGTEKQEGIAFAEVERLFYKLTRDDKEIANIEGVIEYIEESDEKEAQTISA